MLTIEEAIQMLSQIQKEYQNRKESRILYTKDDKIPQTIIEIYLNYVVKPEFDIIYEEYKNKYIYNESKVEENTSPEERKGLGV